MLIISVLAGKIIPKSSCIWSLCQTLLATAGKNASDNLLLEILNKRKLYYLTSPPTVWTDMVWWQKVRSTLTATQLTHIQTPLLALCVAWPAVISDNATRSKWNNHTVKLDLRAIAAEHIHPVSVVKCMHCICLPKRSCWVNNVDMRKWEFTFKCTLEVISCVTCNIKDNETQKLQLSAAQQTKHCIPNVTLMFAHYTNTNRARQ